MGKFAAVFGQIRLQSEAAQGIGGNAEAEIKNAGENDKTASMDQLNIDDLNNFIPDPLPPLTEPLEALALPDPRQHPEIDPRAEDMPEDSEAWSKLLVTAHARDADLQMALYTMRACGTRLRWVWNPAAKHKTWRLRPDVGPQAWASEKEFRETADRYMGAKRGEVAKLLEWVSDAMRGE